MSRDNSCAIIEDVLCNNVDDDLLFGFILQNIKIDPCNTFTATIPDCKCIRIKFYGYDNLFLEIYDRNGAIAIYSLTQIHRRK